MACRQGVGFCSVHLKNQYECKLAYIFVPLRLGNNLVAWKMNVPTRRELTYTRKQKREAEDDAKPVNVQEGEYLSLVILVIWTTSLTALSCILPSPTTRTISSHTGEVNLSAIQHAVLRIFPLHTATIQDSFWWACLLCLSLYTAV